MNQPEINDYGEEVIICYTNVIRINQNYTITYNYRGITYIGLGRPDEALKDFNKAIELDPNYAPAYLNLGTAYIRLGRNKLAANSYNDYLRLIGNKDGNAEKVRGCPASLARMRISVM